MTDKSDTQANFFQPTIRVFHHNLKREDEESIYKSSCPICALGILLVGRDQKTLLLRDWDRCILCGQALVTSCGSGMSSSGFS